MFGLSPCRNRWWCAMMQAHVMKQSAVNDMGLVELCWVATSCWQLIWQQRWQICGWQVGYICTLDSINKVRITLGEAQSLEVHHTTQNDLRVIIDEWLFSVIFLSFFFPDCWRYVNETLESRTIDNGRLICYNITITVHCLNGNDHETECAIWHNHFLTLASGQHSTVSLWKKKLLKAPPVSCRVSG